MDERRDFDCLDFKLMLTALVDGTAPPEGRQVAERHALSCPACLKLLEEAEATDFTLKLSARAEPAVLPEGFADRVIEGTRRESGERATRAARGASARWREGTAWIAAAAALGMAIVAWTMRGDAGWRGGGHGDIVPIAAPVFSGVRELTDADLESAVSNAARTETIVSLLDALADSIDAIAALDPADPTATQDLARAVTAETLLARASLLRISVPLEQRADIQATEAALLALTAGCLDAARLEELQSNIRSLGLAQRLRDLSRSIPRVLAAA